MPQDTDVTRLLIAWSGGEEAAAAPLMDAVYGELRRLAAAISCASAVTIRWPRPRWFTRPT